MPRNSEVNFYLKPVNPETGKAVVYLLYRYSGYKIEFSFGQRVDPNKWNKGKQRLKSNNTTTTDGKQTLNELLDKLKSTLENAYSKEISERGVPTPDVLKKYLEDFYYQRTNKDSLYTLIQRFIDGEIKSKRGREKSSATIRAYKVTMKALKDFESAKGYRITYETITKDFYNKWIDYLRKKRGINDNTIGNRIKDLKAFMAEAVERGYTDNLKFKSFIKPSNETEAVYLTKKEILQLYYHDFKGNKSYEQVKDLFCFGAQVGLRFSDYNSIKPENIIEEDGRKYIKIITQKTKELVKIPATPIVLDIFRRYDHSPNKLPKKISNQKFNEIIKKACKDAGLEEIGRLAADPTLPLYKLVSSHTARRSMITNYYQEGVPAHILMKISGHRSLTAFERYVKVTQSEAAKELSDHIDKTWSEQMLRIA